MSGFKGDSSKNDDTSQESLPKTNQQSESTSLPESFGSPGKPQRRQFSYVPVKKGASIREVEQAVNSVLEDPNRPTTTLTAGREQSSGELSATGKVDVKAEAAMDPGSQDAGRDKDTPFFKDDKNALLMVVKQEGGP